MPSKLIYVAVSEKLNGGLHECTEYGKVGQSDKVDEQCLGADAPGVAGWSGLVTQRDCQEGVSIMGIVPA